LLAGGIWGDSGERGKLGAKRKLAETGLRVVVRNFF